MEKDGLIAIAHLCAWVYICMCVNFCISVYAQIVCILCIFCVHVLFVFAYVFLCMCISIFILACSCVQTCIGAWVCVCIFLTPCCVWFWSEIIKCHTGPRVLTSSVPLLPSNPYILWLWNRTVGGDFSLMLGDLA